MALPVTPLDFLFLGFALVIGAGLGSFSTALIHRLPRGISIVCAKGSASRSECPKCHHQLSLRDLIPVVSWVFSRGKCRYCQSQISKTYPLTELATALLCGVFYCLYGQSALSVVLIMMAPILISIIVIDAHHMIIPNVLNLGVALGALAMLIYTSLGLSNYFAQNLILESAAGAISFGGIAYFLRFIFTQVYKKEALGLGDVKFFGAVGFWLGASILPYFMMIGGFLGVVYAISRKKFSGKDSFPFGPALVCAFIILIIAKKSIF